MAGWSSRSTSSIGTRSRPWTASDFAGIDDARATPEVVAAIDAAGSIVIAPSNPTRVDRSDPGRSRHAAALAAARERGVPLVAVSGIVGGKALKGPADRMLTSLGEEASALGVARRYRSLASHFVMDDVDAALREPVEALGLGALVTDTIMTDDAARARLAGEVLESSAGEQRSPRLTATPTSAVAAIDRPVGAPDRIRRQVAPRRGARCRGAARPRPAPGGRHHPRRRGDAGRRRDPGHHARRRGPRPRARGRRAAAPPAESRAQRRAARGTGRGARRPAPRRSWSCRSTSRRSAPSCSPRSSRGGRPAGPLVHRAGPPRPRHQACCCSSRPMSSTSSSAATASDAHLRRRHRSTGRSSRRARRPADDRPRHAGRPAARPGPSTGVGRWLTGPRGGGHRRPRRDRPG